MLITSQKEADEIFEKLSREPYVTIDSEFKWISTYSPIPALIQIGTKDDVFLFDPTEIKDFTSLKNFLEAENCIKILHSCSQDLILFYDMCRAVTAPIFDTQVAYAFLNRKHQISYGGLVEEVTGTELSKGSQRSDWLRRPLSPKQLEYAKNDVTWLYKCYQTVIARLKEAHRYEWVLDECEQYTDKSQYEPVKPQNAYRSLKGVGRLNRDQLSVMRELCAWREETAIKVNLRPRKLVSEETLFSIVYKLPRNSHDLKKCRGISSVTMRHNSRDILNCIDIGLALEEYQKPPLIEKRVPSKREEKIAQKLYDHIDALGEKLNIATALLMTRQQCKKIAQWHCEKLNMDFKFLSPWRMELLKEDIMAVLDNR
ncbi:MAG: HRDC domain-containing protein [Lentisphaeraceae bacterium]|nr:HRDC domain-containing protein [Lentisphaeraceae bacterium]